MSFPRYSSYRDSKVMWLGELPSHWLVTQSRRLFRQRKERARNEDRQLTASQKHGIIYQDDFMRLEDQKVMQVIYGADILKRVEPNDFVISMRSFEGGIEHSRLGGSISSAYVMLVPSNGVCSDFFKWLFKSKGYVQALQATTNLVRDGQALRYQNFTLVPLPLPSREEQVAIATFLDSETAKIDTLVEEQQRLIELLKEKRQAVVSQAVTKGLDPSVPMKDSGIEWLGEVPQHWTVAPLKRLLSILSGYAFPSVGFSADAAHTRLLRGVNVGVGRIRWDDVVYWSREDGDRLEAWELKAGDVVLGMDRPWISDGLRVAKLSDEDLPCLLLQRVAALRPSGLLLSDYLPHLLQGQAFFHHCVPEMTGVSVPHISPGQIGDFIVALPPSKEQAKILEFSEKIVDDAERLTATAETAIALLQERRAALISAAVTGQIDVRNFTKKAEAA